MIIPENCGERHCKGQCKWELNEKLGVKLGVNQIKILALLKASPHDTRENLSEKIGISVTAIENNLAKLKKKGLIKRVGPDKGGHWETL